MTNLTLKQLRYVEALARLRHFGRAATDCNVSQPALSMQIRALEEELGVVLFERGPREVRLTGFGETFLARSKEILRAVDELNDLTRSAQTSLIGRLRMGIIPTIAPYLLPRIVARLNISFPETELHIRETLTSRLLDDFNAGRLDCAIIAIPSLEPTLAEAPLLVEEFVFVRPKEDAAKPVPDSETLAKMRLLLLEEGHCFRDQTLEFCDLRPTAARDGLDGSNLSTLVQMVAAGLGVTILPAMAVEVETKSADVSLARFTPPRPTRTIGMVWRRSSPLTGVLSELAIGLRDELNSPQTPSSVAPAAKR